MNDQQNPVAELRRKMGISQTELANRIGASIATVARMERKINPTRLSAKHIGYAKLHALFKQYGLEESKK